MNAAKEAALGAAGQTRQHTASFWNGTHNKSGVNPLKWKRKNKNTQCIGEKCRKTHNVSRRRGITQNVYLTRGNCENGKETRRTCATIAAKCNRHKSTSYNRRHFEVYDDKTRKNHRACRNGVCIGTNCRRPTAGT